MIIYSVKEYISSFQVKVLTSEGLYSNLSCATCFIHSEYIFQHILNPYSSQVTGILSVTYVILTLLQLTQGTNQKCWI